MRGRRVAVIGGGFTGAAQAIALARAGARVTLIERGAAPGRGVAYGTRHADHLLNVRASGMSAFAQTPDHFARWFARHDGAPDDFAQRRLYGTYVTELLADEAGIETVIGEATAIEPDSSVRLTDGRTVSADAVVLAIGNLPPLTPGGLSADVLDSEAYIADPWAVDIAAGLGADDAALLIGTGLTAIDVALILDSAGFAGSILALSRRGLAPRPHAANAVAASPLTHAPVDTRASALLSSVRAEAERIGWRAAVDQLRPATQALWRRASRAEQARFLRHLRPWWDVHRHRIAPAIAARIASMEADGRLRVVGGRILSGTPAPDGVTIVWQPRGATNAQIATVARIVNCTGPLSDIRRAGEPMIDALIAAGKLRPDPLRLGIDVDADCRVLGADGSPVEGLYAVGPLTKGAFWEIVAVPDIRQQVAAVAARIAG